MVLTPSYIVMLITNVLFVCLFVCLRVLRPSGLGITRLGRESSGGEPEPQGPTATRHEPSRRVAAAADAASADEMETNYRESSPVKVAPVDPSPH